MPHVEVSAVDRSLHAEARCTVDRRRRAEAAGRYEDLAGWERRKPTGWSSEIRRVLTEAVRSRRA